MAQKILKLHPIPSGTSIGDIKQIFHDFKIEEVSIKGDAAYVKFSEFGEAETDVLDFTFENYEYKEKGWDAKISLLPASDWDSSEEEVIEHGKEHEAEEIKPSPVQEEKETEDIHVPEELVSDGPEVVSWNGGLSSDNKLGKSSALTQVSEIPQVPQVPKVVEAPKVEEIVYEAPKVNPPVHVPEVIEALKIQPPPFKKQEVSAVLPQGVKEEVQQLLYEAKQAAVSQLNNVFGQPIPSWIWPLALVFTLLSLSMH